VSERSYDLEQLRADGWFDRVIASVPALERLCTILGEPLVALALAAGIRIETAAVDRVSSEVTTISWVRDDASGKEVAGSGGVGALRTEVLSTLLGEADVLVKLPDEPGIEALRNAVGQRYVMLAPLFGLTLRRLTVIEGEEPRVVVFHSGIEEIVPLKQLRRFLRSRVIDLLQQDRSRSVAIDLEQAEVARVAFAQGRYEEVVGRLAGWVAPLTVFHRTPEGAALNSETRAEISRALGLLGETFSRLGRADEGEETLRLAVQYGQDSPAAAELYRTLARTMMHEGRFAEAIAPLRRSLSLEPDSGEALLDLAVCFLGIQRVVAAYGCLREARARGVITGRIERVEAEVRRALGDSVTRYESALRPADTIPPPPLTES
jgi:tetratricopeptide (TPR) repeat protein